MICTLQVVRHQKQVSGARDPDIHPINPSSLAHIKPYDVIVCSPYKRCRHTAMEINRLLGVNARIIVDSRLSEYRTGNVRGKMDPESVRCATIPTNEKCEIMNEKVGSGSLGCVAIPTNEKWNGESGKMESESVGCSTIPTNEKWSDVQARLDEALSYIQSIQGNVLVVTHGVVVNYYEQKILGNTLYQRGHDVP